MSFTLYEDQVEFVSNIRNQLGQYKKIIACAATGFGKSKVFIYIARGAISKGKTVLIITERKKIFNQIKAEEPDAELIDPDNHHVYLSPNRIYIAMAQTLCKREELVKQLIALGPNLLTICDEAHLGHFNKILEKTPDSLRLGFTATPDARWAKHLPIFYKNIVVGPQPHELVLKGRLCGYKHFARIGADMDKLVLQGGDFTEASQEAAFQNAKVFEGLIEDLRNVPYKKCMIYTASIKDCNIVTNELKRNGIKCVAVHKNSKEHKCNDKEFDFRLSRFNPRLSKTPVPEDEVVNVCVSVGTLTTGYDYDEIDLIVVRRATTSLPVYLQMLGRGGRVLDSERLLPIDLRVKKRHFTVLDYGGNYLRFGLWDSEREWKDLWNKPKKSKEGVAPVKLCPQCEFITNVSAKTCPNCGHEYEKKDIPFQVGELIEITEMYTKNIVGKRVGELTPKELAIYARLKSKKNFAARVARAREISEPGYIAAYGKEMNYKDSWAEWQKKNIDEDIGGENTKFINFVLA